MSDLLAAIEAADLFGRVEEHLAGGKSCAVGGLWGSSCAYFMAAVQHKCPSIILAVTPGPEEADDLCNDINLFKPDSATLLPARESLPSEVVTSSDTV